MRESGQSTIKVISEGLAGIKESKVIGCNQFFIDKAKHYQQIYGNSAVELDSLRLIPRIAIETLLVVVIVGSITLGLSRGADPSEQIGPLAVIGVASLRLIPAYSAISNSIISMQSTNYSIDVIYNKLLALNTIIANTNIGYDAILVRKSIKCKTSEPFIFQKCITLENISFEYINSYKSILRDVSLTIHKGTSIAIVGKSGAGKSTLVNIIIGLLEPSHGDIKVNGVSIYSDIRAWQNLIAYIPQSIFLYDDTLARNIALGVNDSSIDRDRLRSAIEAAQLSDFVYSLPDRFSTVIGENGVRISGGQRQRIGIARALYFGREILIFDEATSALDHETEKSVIHSIHSLQNTMNTIIMITHRLQTVSQCNTIYMLESGKIVKSGSFSEVIG
jgi:ABC-type bacteriocin/lantibiotic exporter with double-glycine peptidase domain